jgi:hypothetical protein
MWILDSLERSGAAKKYNSTDRLAMGDQYKDREIDLTEGGSRVFASASSQRLTNTGTAPVTAAPLSMGVWIKLTTLPSDGNYIVLFVIQDSGATSGNESYFESYLSNSSGVYTLYAATSASDDEDVSSLVVTGDIDTSNWHFIYATFGSITSRYIFMDDAWGVEGTASRTPGGLDETAFASAYYGDAWAGFVNGKLAHPFIYNVELTAIEVARLAAGALPTEIRPEALVAYWPLIDDDNDPIGGYNMTPYNSPTWSTIDYPDVFKPDKGKWEIQDILPAVIDESGFQSDGAWHIMPINPRVKPDTDNDDLKTAPDIDATGAVFESIAAVWLLNEGSGDPSELITATETATLSGCAWADDGDRRYNPYLDFDGSGYAILSSNASGQFNMSGAKTIIVRVRFDSFASSEGIIAKTNNSNWDWDIYASAANDISIYDDNNNQVTVWNAATLSTGVWYTFVVVLDGTNCTTFISGIKDTATIAALPTERNYNIVIGSEDTAGTSDLNGDISFAYLIDRALSDDEARFISQNSFYPFGESIRSKYTIDRTRIRPNTVIHDWPFQYGTVASPTSILLNHLKMDDNAANNTLDAVVGPDGTWHLVSDDSARNTDNDSVAADNFRGRALDTQGTAYGQLAFGSGTVHDNAFYKKGSILIKATPQFNYDVGVSQYLFNCYVNATDYFGFGYRQGSDQFRCWFEWGDSNIDVDSRVFTDNYSLQRPMVFLISWDSDKDMVLLALDGQVENISIDSTALSSSHPTQFNLGLKLKAEHLEGDIIIDEIKTFSEAVLPYGAYFIGNGQGLLADIDNPHADLCFFWDAQSVNAKGGTNLATSKTGTLGSANTGGAWDHWRVLRQ